jgi:Transposase DDE domain
MDWEDQLIAIFVHIFQRYESELWVHAQRLSPNETPDFHDAEILTVYLWGVMQIAPNKKKIHRYTQQHLSSWFPALPSYQAFSARLNRLSQILPHLFEELVATQEVAESQVWQRVMDSMPIILAKGSRSRQAKVATELANQTYCSSKDLWYHGVKLHILGVLRPGRLPAIEYYTLTPASTNDIEVLKDLSEDLVNTQFFGDKAYCSEALQQQLQAQEGALMTPHKRKRNAPPLTLLEEAYNTLVSKVRQPIEANFNWLQALTQIQTASRVRSLKGLLVHVHGCLVAVLMMRQFGVNS